MPEQKTPLRSGLWAAPCTRCSVLPVSEARRDLEPEGVLQEGKGLRRPPGATSSNDGGRNAQTSPSGSPWEFFAIFTPDTRALCRAAAMGAGPAGAESGQEGCWSAVGQKWEAVASLEEPAAVVA